MAEEKKTPWRKLYPSDHLMAEDLDGKEFDMVIEKVVEEEVRNENGKEPKLVAYFKGAKKGMVLNVTNNKTLQKLTGSRFYEDWAGQAVTVYGKWIKAFGEDVLALRIKQRPPKAE